MIFLGRSDVSTFPLTDVGHGYSLLLREAILKGIARGDIWLAKIRRDQHGERIYRECVPRGIPAYPVGLVSWNI